MDNKPKVQIEDWYLSDSVYGYSLDPFDFECKRQQFLHGFIYGHPRLGDGAHVHTSYIVKVETRKREVETRNSVYELGKPNARWIAAMLDQYPDVYGELFYQWGETPDTTRETPKD